MSKGTIQSIHVTAAAKEPMRSVDQVHAIPGVGLDGDRYALKLGTFSKPTATDFELTLIEAESLDAMQRDYSLQLAAGDARRNLVTRGVALNHLVGREFTIGEVKVRGMRLCEPCGYLQKMTGIDVIKGLRHRGGLRAAILSDGLIRVGDAVRD